MAALASYFSVVRMSHGQRISAYNQMRPIAERQDFFLAVRQVDKAKAHDIGLGALEARWAAQQAGGLYPPELQVTDGLSDNTLTGVREVAMGHIRGLPPGARLRTRVEEFLENIFPGGVGATTSLPYVDQVAAMEIIVAKLQGEHKDMVEELGLHNKVRYLAELTIAYRRLVDAGVQPVSFAEVRATRDRGHELELELIAIIMGTYHDSENPDHVRKREELLAPLRKQIDITHAQIRTRRYGRMPDSPELPEEDIEDQALMLAELDAMDEPALDAPAES